MHLHGRRDGKDLNSNNNDGDNVDAISTVSTADPRLSHRVWHLSLPSAIFHTGVHLRNGRNRRGQLVPGKEATETVCGARAAEETPEI